MMPPLRTLFRSLRTVVFISICALLSLLARAEEYTARVVAVHDADTLTLLQEGNTQVKVRLASIDGPELGQPFGSKAKEFCSSLAFGKTVSIRAVDIDRYGRTVAWVTLPDKTVLNEKLVEVGLAHWYQYFDPNNKRLKELQDEAKKNKRGLWSDAHPIEPWEWRKKH